MKSMRRSPIVKLIMPLPLLVFVCSGAVFLNANMPRVDGIMIGDSHVVSDCIMIGDAVTKTQTAMVNDDDISCMR